MVPVFSDISELRSSAKARKDCVFVLDRTAGAFQLRGRPILVHSVDARNSVFYTAVMPGAGLGRGTCLLSR